MVNQGTQITKRKYILLHALGGSNAVFFGEGARDNCNEPTIALKQRCRQLGYELEVTKEQPLDECEWLIFHDIPSIGPTRFADILKASLRNQVKRRFFRNIYREALDEHMQNRMVLIIAEPPSVYPGNFDKSYHAAFKYVFTWDKNLADGVKYVHAILPVTAMFPPVQSFPFADRKLLVDISGNKFSAHKNELYTERRNAIRFFEKRFPDDFDLYGTGWNLKGLQRTRDTHVYTSYRGSVEHKSQVLPRYKYVICYENIAGQTDYVSNRIFDVLRCGCVPIYLGTPNISEYVDQDSFIDRNAFDSNEDLARYISGIGEKVYQSLIDAGKAYLASEKFKQFLSTRWVDLIVSTLSLDRNGVDEVSTT